MHNEDRDLAGEERWASLTLEPPDDLDEILGHTALLNAIVAERLQFVDWFHRRAIADARTYGDGIAEVRERSVRLELAAAMRVTEHAAADLLWFAGALLQRYPRAHDALASSRITERHARILAELLDQAGPEIAERLAEEALTLAVAHPVGTFRRKLRDLIERDQTRTLESRHTEALAQRRVIIEAGADGMGWLHLHAPMVEIAAIHARITGQAKPIASHPDEDRILDQVRADVACDLLIDGDTRLLPPEVRGIRPTVAVTVPVLSLLERDPDAEGVEPPMVEGIGPITIPQAKQLCGSADGWMRVLTHPESGIVLSVGRDRYKPPPGLARLVKWRAGRCMAPGCHQPTERCEIDHTLAWEHGGHTCLGNLCPLCKGHHTLKHHGGWTVEHLPRGALKWTSPSGRTYTVEPERRIPAFTTQHETAPAPF